MIAKLRSVKRERFNVFYYSVCYPILHVSYYIIPFNISM